MMKTETLLNETLAFAGNGYLTRRRATIVVCALCLALLLATLLSMAIGSESIPLGQLMMILPAKLLGQTPPLSREQEVILFSLRLPRIAMALGVGAALGVAGAAFQALLRNPLADPYVLGVSGGAALGSILAIMLASQYTMSRPLFGFAGACASTFVVYQIGRRRDAPAHLILAGVVISTFLSSVIVLLTALADNIRLRNITLWLLGDLSSGTTEATIFVIASAIGGACLLVTQSRALNLLMIGEREAFSMGIEIARVRLIVYLTASLLTGAAVTAGGAIGYVGLVVPHLVRLAGGADNRLVIPASAASGALLVLLSDTIARTALAPRELPTGAITALIGAPVLIYLLMRTRHA
ncbi:MAG: iron ABC transporter permease [Blastocatellia bacterium]|nr:iron ABC transporter permease [Blastocatellia bacterium]